MIKRLFLITLLCGFVSSRLIAQQANSFIISTPEKEGISSQAIINFLDAIGNSKHEFHSFVFLRHGKLVAEGWWNPYRPDLKHTMYSTSKSFTATAVGFAIAEKRLRLTDKLISFFPQHLPDTISPFLASLTIKDALIMADGQDPDPSFQVASNDSDWVRGFLSTPIRYEPGSRFLYNSLGTYMLSAVVQKVTGQRIVDYLRPRLFQPLGISDVDWEEDLQHINTGGWGLRIRTRDMAKFGQLFLQKGKWKGKQVLPKGWVEEASSKQILQHPEFTDEQREKSDWEQGYGYQMWRCRNNAFRADGAYGQYIIVMPDQDAVIAITSETADMQEELNLVWQYLLPAMKQKSLIADPRTALILRHRLASLALPHPDRHTHSPFATTVAGKTYTLEENSYQLKSVAFNYTNGVWQVSLNKGNTVYPLHFGAGIWQPGETKMLGPSLVYHAKGHFVGLPPSKIAGTYAWKTDKELELQLRYIDSPHTETLRCVFDDQQLQMEISESQDFGKRKTIIKGQLSN